LIYSLLYYGAGAALGLAVLLTLYWYFFRLDLNYAVISLPLHPVISQDVRSVHNQMAAFPWTFALALKVSPLQKQRPFVGAVE
jgi:hypothetical protein